MQAARAVTDWLACVPQTDFNLSLVEYELVPVPVAEGSSSAAAAEGSSGNGSGVAAGQDGIAAS